MKFFLFDRLETVFIKSESSAYGNAPQCKVCGLNLGGLHLLPPITGELWLYAEYFSDLIEGGSSLIMSERARDAFLHSQLKGVGNFLPVTVTKVKRFGRKKLINSQSQYFLAYVIHSRAAIDDNASGLERSENPVCYECRLDGIIKRAKRVELEANTWYGEDIFIARGLPGTIIVSERFKSFCENNKFLGIKLIPATEYAFDFYPE